MARIDEIGPDLYRICIYVPAIDLQFNHFLVKDDEPLLFHTGMRRMFPDVRDAVAKIIDPAALRWISWSHFEVDECGALNEWLAVAPQATPVCSECGAMVNLADFSNRPPRGLVIAQVPKPVEPHASSEPLVQFGLLGRCGPGRRFDNRARQLGVSGGAGSGDILRAHGRDSSNRPRRSSR